MFGSRRSRSASGVIAVGLLLATLLAVGCGASAPAKTVPIARVVPPLVTRTESQVTQSGAAGNATPRPTTTADPSASHGIPPAHPVPAAFRPAPGALSDAEVRNELGRLSAIERRERERQLSAAAANLAGLLPWSLEEKQGVSVASVFRDYGLGLACGGVLGRYQLGVAHKTAPCGTLVTFTYGGRSLTVPVIDRGPYIAGREWDLTGATAEALGFPGLGEIQWQVAG
jgi:hypothetical protein